MNHFPLIAPPTTLNSLLDDPFSFDDDVVAAATATASVTATSTNTIAKLSKMND